MRHCKPYSDSVTQHKCLVVVDAIERRIPSLIRVDPSRKSWSTHALTPTSFRCPSKTVTLARLGAHAPTLDDARIATIGGPAWAEIGADINFVAVAPLNLGLRFRQTNPSTNAVWQIELATTIASPPPRDD